MTGGDTVCQSFEAARRAQPRAEIEECNFDYHFDAVAI